MIVCVLSAGVASQILLQQSNGGLDQMRQRFAKRIFKQACAANKDTIDEMMKCYHKSDFLVQTVRGEDLAKTCYKKVYGTEFDHKDVMTHKEIVCKSPEKLEQMRACLIKNVTEKLSQTDLRKLPAALRDVGRCALEVLNGD